VDQRRRKDGCPKGVPGPGCAAGGKALWMWMVMVMMELEAVEGMKDTF
jgi:hypothetical protein